MKYVIENEEQYDKFLREHVLSTKEAREILAITRSGVSFLVQEDKLKVLKDEGRVRLFSRLEIERYKRERDGKSEINPAL